MKRRQTTPLHEAAAAGDEARIDALLADGADDEAQDEQGHTPADLASINGHPHLIQKLMRIKFVPMFPGGRLS